MGDILTSCCNFLVEYGYLPRDHDVKSFDDIEMTSAIAKFQRLDQNAAIAAQAAGAPPLIPDGQIGPATLYAMSLPRCGEPDNAAFEPVTGSGGWRNCHGIEDGHKAIVRVYEDGMPSFLKPHFRDILSLVQRSYAEIGLLFVFVQKTGSTYTDLVLNKPATVSRINIDFTFQRGDGWIGLAIVGTGQSGNQKCSSKIWAKFEPKYKPANISREWVTLIKHELGHNCGLRHGGKVMNPSIINGLPWQWTDDDSSTAILRRWFGGQPIDIPGDTPPNPPNDDWPPVGSPISDSFVLANGMRARLYREFG